MSAESKINEPRRIALLLADRAISPLTETENVELAMLLARHPEIDDSELDEAAAALNLMKPVLPESMPDALRARVFADARRFFAAQDGTNADAVLASAPVAALPHADAEPHIASALPTTAQAATNLLTFQPADSPSKGNDIQPDNPAQTAAVIAFPLPSQPSRRVEESVETPRVSWAGRLGWLAAAACLAFALVGAWKVREQQRQIAALNAPKPAPDFAAQRQALIAKGEQVIQLNWAAGTFPGMQKVSGDVVWSDTAQQGYMRFVGMPANDPDKLVYQLWIFAANQEEAYPIDGGVFNISSNGEVIVPINAKLLVNKPSLFAVTIEKPGGVVVSKRDKLALLAKVG